MEVNHNQGSPPHQNSPPHAFSLAQSISPVHTAQFLDPNSAEANKGNKSVVPSLVINEVDEKNNGEKTTDSRDRTTPTEDNFATYVHSLEQKEENPRQKLQNLNQITDKALYLNIVKEGLTEVNQLKEKAELAYSEIDTKVISFIL